MSINKEKLIEHIRYNVKQIIYLQLQEGLFGTETKSLPSEVGFLPLYIKNLKKRRAAQGRGDSIGKEFFGHLGGGIGQSVTTMAKETGLLGTKSLGRLNLSKVGSGIAKGALPSVARAAMTVISPSAFSAALRDKERINQFLRDRSSPEGKAALALAGEKIKAGQERARAVAMARAKVLSNRNRGIVNPTDQTTPYPLEGEVFKPKELSNPPTTEPVKPTGPVQLNLRGLRRGINPGNVVLGNKIGAVRSSLTGSKIPIGPLGTQGRRR